MRKMIDDMQKADITIYKSTVSGSLSDTLKMIREQERKHAVLFSAAAAPIATAFTSKVSKTSKKSVENVVKSSLQVEKATITDSKRTENVIDKAIAENVDLIKSIPKEHFSKIEEAVRLNFEGIKPGGVTLQQRIKEIGGVTESRARLIARDQTSKLTAQVNRSRYMELGAKKYIWKTLGGNRVVGTPGGLYPKGSKLHGNHYVRNNKVFYYNNPPSDGSPGEPIQCRCVAQPIFENIEENRNVKIN